MNIIEVNGVKLNFEETGTGPSVVLVHGIPSDYRTWKAQVDALSRDFRTISYSRRCAFPNQCTDYAGSTVENNARDLEKLIVRTGGGKVRLVGQSYGAGIAALCALEHPELVRGLVLIEPYLPGVVMRPDSRARGLSLLIRKPSVARSGLKSVENIKATLQEVYKKNPEKALDSYYPSTWDGGNVKVQLPETARAIMLDNMEGFKELTTQPPSFGKEDAARIAMPTLIIGGEHTTDFMKAVAETLHKRIPNNQLVVVRNAAHYPQIENPKECNDAILKFLSEHAR
jgi:pimeloyl-ACP methyl ester carboxylesterase